MSITCTYLIFIINKRRYTNTCVCFATYNFQDISQYCQRSTRVKSLRPKVIHHCFEPRNRIPWTYVIQIHVYFFAHYYQISLLTIKPKSFRIHIILITALVVLWSHWQHPSQTHIISILHELVKNPLALYIFKTPLLSDEFSKTNNVLSLSLSLSLSLPLSLSLSPHVFYKCMVLGHDICANQMNASARFNVIGPMTLHLDLFVIECT